MSSGTHPSPRRRILFVDDDAQFLQMIDRVMRLRSRNHLEILTAQTASSALALLQDHPLDLVVLDVCMPVVDGLQFLSILSRRFPALQKVVLTGFATEAYRTACLSNGAELFLEKPRTSEGLESIFATLDELSRWKPEPGFRGVLRRVGLIDIIQMECLGRSSSVLAVLSPEISGTIYIREGFIIHAEAGPLKGEPAFKKLLGIGSGDFRLNPYVEPTAETIQGSWEGLLMDAAQTRDEMPEPAPAAVEPVKTEVDTSAGSAILAALAQTPVQIEELLICSESGDVFHSWQCANTELRINFLEFLSQKARVLHNLLPVGTFDRAEFRGRGGRLVAQIGAGRGVILRTAAAGRDRSGESTPEGKRALSMSISSPEKKERAKLWFNQHLGMAGLLAATLQFADRSGTSHSSSPGFAPDALQTLRRCVSDGFQVLNLQRFPSNRARWCYDDLTIESMQWADGTSVALVLSRQAMDLNAAALEQSIQAFLNEEECTTN